MLSEVMALGVPWWLAKEAIASTALDRDHDGHTQVVDSAGYARVEGDDD